ncbi:MAG TPA: GNAT family N-acetyltransferase [Bacillota bacterium]|nr:GNAT family N-acetyltransferase [Bacillota bacterium]HOK69015.1 GNAT family N-acetyltransferase [Bacillota bacterium]HPP85776.1 GNAT family N-acetyltransferase [Bacillota bacterium]
MTVYNQILRYIEAHLKEEITASQIATNVGYSANHIYKLFKVYSPYPIMEYIRRMKLFHALSEMYTGRRLYDIALDYGYETPAGFYKAFKAVFGCTPSEYKKNNIQKEGISTFIDNVKNINELDEVLAFAKTLYPDLTFDFGGEGDDKYSRNFWLKEWKKNPELLLFAKEDDRVCGVILGWAENSSVTIGGDGVSVEYKNMGIHESLLVEIEKRAKRLGHKNIVLGIGEGEEEFYAKMGYTGKTLIQSEKYSVEELKKFNEQYKNYEATGAGVYDGHIHQLWLDSSLLDKGLKERFEKEIGDCRVQIIVNKEL